jgi:CheY-like chemotaxis protein
MAAAATKKIRILMAEDSPSDAELARMAFSNGGFESELTIVEDGVEAMEYLRNVGKYADCAKPDLILLDLNMPRKDGKTVLSEIKADKELAKIPVVILTTSRDEQDIEDTYSMFASSYVAKPLDFDQFVDATKSIKEFYFKVAKLPGRG